MMKKLLIHILTLSLIIGSVFGSAVSVNAAEEAGITESQTITDAKRLMNAAGSVVSVSDSGVTRGDFLVALISSMNIDLSSSLDKQYFSDVERDSQVNTAAGYAIAGDIISAGQSFSPDRNVTYSEAIKMAVSALGYGVEAKARGGYPTGYFAVGSKIDLLLGITYSPEKALSADDFYLLMRNFFECPVRSVDGIANDGTEIMPSYTDGGSILTTAYGWELVEGIISADENTYLYDDESSINGILINDKTYLCDLDYTIGMNVKAYSKEEGGKSRIVYLETEGLNNIETINPSDIEDTSSASIVAYQNGKSRKYNLNGLLSIIYNGKFYSGSVAVCETITTGSITLIDNNTDGKYDVCIVKNGLIMDVGSNNDYSECIYDNISGSIIDYSGEKNIRVYIEGELSSVAVIKSGDVLEYYESEDRAAVEIHILKNIVDGKLTAIANDVIYINDVEYKTSDYFKNHNSASLKLGASASFVLASDGTVAAVNRNDSEGAIYAYMIGIIRGGNFFNHASLKLFNVNGELLTLDTASKIQYNDTEIITGEELYNRLSLNGEQTIRYKVNGDGLITSIYVEDPNSLGIFDPSVDNPNGLKRYNFDGYDSETKIYYKSFGTFVPHFTIDANSKVIFVNSRDLVPTEADRFSVGGMDSLKNDASTPGNRLLVYNVSSAGRAPFLVCLSGTSGGSVNNASSYGVIESVTRALDKKEESAYKITLCSGNEYRSYFVPDNSSLVLTNKIVDENGNITLQCGDYVRYTANSNMELNDITVDFSYSKKLVNHSVDRENHEVNYYYGTLYDYADTAIRINLISSSTKGSGYPISLVNNKTYVWLVDTQAQTVTAVLPQTMISEMQNSNSPDKILFKTRYASIQEVVVYR